MKRGVHIELGSKETWALITWLVFATYLHADHKVGKVNSYFGWSRFLCYLICYLGVNFLEKDCIVTVGYLK
jgi:ABC-type transport system involved in cytochrome c biogenesis permease subunit